MSIPAPRRVTGHPSFEAGILDRGFEKHWRELERFYGKPAIIAALREKVAYLTDESIDEASSFFNLEKEEMLCYKRKQSMIKLWL